MNKESYIAIDCNGTGKILEKHIFSGDLRALGDYSRKLAGAIEDIASRIEELGGKVYMKGGDNILAGIDRVDAAEIAEITRSVEDADMIFAIGLGDSAVDAYLALKYAKANKRKEAVSYRNNQFGSL